MPPANVSGGSTSAGQQCDESLPVAAVPSRMVLPVYASVHEEVVKQPRTLR